MHKPKPMPAPKRETRGGSWRDRDRGELNGEAQVLEALNEAAGGGGLVSLVKVVGAEILVERPVLEHVIDGAQKGGGDSADGLKGAPTRNVTVELGVEVAALGSGGRPGAREERRFQPA